MKETLRSTGDNATSAELEHLAGPKGIGMAVAFDWGLTVQLLVGPILPLLFGGSGFLKQFNMSAPVEALVTFLLSLPFAALIAIFGEGVRRGWRWTRPIQIVFNTLGFLGGFAVLAGLVQSSRQGHYWSIVTAVILLIFSPLIAWRLSRPESARWFARVSSAQARKRHGGAWPFYIALWAIVGGTLQALAVFLK